MALRVTAPPVPKEGHSHVVQVAVGRGHCLLLTDEGVVYSWGSRNDHGQLGRPTASESSMQEPGPILDGLRDEIIVQIACGTEHCLALSKRGALFVWGWNRAGQLGLGLSATSKEKDLMVRTPTQVKVGDHPVVKSCTCGPESSACVTWTGEVYVWGAFSYHMFSHGSRYARGEDFTRPVRVRGTPPVDARDCGFVPDQVALGPDQLACTMAPRRLEEDLGKYIASLKTRSTQLMSVARSARPKAAPAAGRASAGLDGLQSDDVLMIEKELKQQKEELEEQVRDLAQQQTHCEDELQRLGRELTVCDQQDTALTESGALLEVRRSELTGETSMQAQSRALDTQLNDIKHFKSSNKKAKLQLLEQRDQAEREHLVIMQNYMNTVQKRNQVDARANLIENLRQGLFISAGGAAGTEGLKIADSKRMELAATLPEVLAGSGNFSGCREVLRISNNALADIYGALGEVNADIRAADSLVLEEVLEANLKLRKEINDFIEGRLDQAQAGRGGLLEFFEEAGRPAEQDWGGLPPRASPPPEAAGGGGGLRAWWGGPGR